MIQLRVLNGRRAGTEYLARDFPVTVGRASGNTVRLAEPGIWDQHLEIQLTETRSFLLSKHDEASATLNDEPLTDEARPVRNGDRIGLGELQLQFSLSPTSQRNPKILETFFWATLVLIALTQVVVIYFLP